MKKALLTLLAITGIALCACSGSKVSQEKFAEEANKVEAHTYTEATVTYDISHDLLLTKDEGKGEIKYTRGDDGKWTTTSEDERADDFVTELEANVRGFQPTSNAEVPENVEMKVEYYVNPFKIVMSAKGSSESAGTKADVTYKGEYQFDKYGYMTYAYTDMKIETTMGSSKIVMFDLETITISYK